MSRIVLIVFSWLLCCLGAEASEPKADGVEGRETPGALVWFKQGVELARNGEYGAALARFERAKTLAPNWALPRMEIAVAHLMTDNDREIIERELEAAVRLGKEIPRAHYLYGVYLEEAGLRTEAIAELTLALRLRPSLVDARYRLATLYVEEGRQAEGIEQYQLVLTQRSSHLGAHRNLAVLYEESGSLEEAERHLKTIADLHPGNTYHLTVLARFYRRAGWEDKARAAFQRAERLDPATDRRRLRPLQKTRESR